MIEHVGYDPEPKRELYLIEVERLEDLPSELSLSSQYFVALVVWDAEGVQWEKVTPLAKLLVDSGCCYVCVWGKDCEKIEYYIEAHWLNDGRWHDWEYQPREEGDVLMSTYHPDEVLGETLWFILNCTTPVERFIKGCRSVVAICIGDLEKANEIRDAFRHPRKWSDQWLEKHPLSDSDSDT